MSRTILSINGPYFCINGKPEYLKSVSIHYKGKSIYEFTAAEMKDKLEAVGYSVTQDGMEDLPHIAAQNRIILTARGSAEADRYLKQPDASPLPSSVPQGYSVRKKTHADYTEWFIIGFDADGAMYGGLNFSEAVQLHGFDGLGDTDVKPYVSQRGIKFNIPLDARTPSYSDSGDSAQANIADMWDMDFWCEFLDEMARNFFNVLSLWSLHPFPSMVKVPEYPDAALQDIKKTDILLSADLQGMGMSTSASLENLHMIKMMTIDEKIEFWRDVMQYAEDRGIDIYIFTWNTFVYGTENSDYGLTTSITDTRTQDYFRKSVKALINTYPLLKGIGITAGENMSRNAEADEAWLYNTYGQGINDALDADESRTFRLIHRIQYANIKKAVDAFSGLNPRCTLDTSFKYAQAHVYSSETPDYVHANNDAYLSDIGDHRTWLTLRDDDYYMFRGGSDPEFIRALIKGLPYEKLQGFYLGADGYTWGREYISRYPEHPAQQVIKKRWYSFMLWGRLSFDPHISRVVFIKALEIRFPGVNADGLYEAWARASRIIPLVNRLHNSDCQFDFQWYPEACTGNTGFHDINRFIKTRPQSSEEIMSIPEYADAVLNHAQMSRIVPVEIAHSLYELSNQAVGLTKDMHAGNNRELEKTIKDINAMAALGRYYSRKISGAVNKCIADRAADAEVKLKYKEAAVKDLKEASCCWKDYSEKVSSLYRSQTLTRLIPNERIASGLPRYVDVTELQRSVDRDTEIAEVC